MEINLRRPYSSSWDNVEYPILKLADESYLCIVYSRNHRCYSINTYTKEEFVEQGFEEDNWYDDIFENLTAEELERYV